jgi:hypothetical protein
MNKVDESIMAGILRVAASNDYANWKKRHKPNLGPYTELNPKHCEDCGKPGGLWVEGETCGHEDQP